jgi:Domain of unknown function (DUF4220)
LKSYFIKYGLFIFFKIASEDNNPNGSEAISPLVSLIFSIVMTLERKKSDSKGLLTIGRVFQLNSHEDKYFTKEHGYWRDSCLSLALAKMLRRRFAKLPLDEAGSPKALNFVLQGLIDYIGTNEDIQTDGSNGRRNPSQRVFSIIRAELKFISDFLNMMVPIYYYFGNYIFVDVFRCFCHGW